MHPILAPRSLAPRSLAPRSLAQGRSLALLLLTSTLAACKSDNSLAKLDADDTFFQVEAGEVDVLLVVDNSGSMQPYQERLSTNFSDFLSFFTGYVDYRIGIVTTTLEPLDPYGPCTQADIDAVPSGGELVGGTWISDEDADGDAVFSDMVQVGTCGAGYEMGLETAAMALTPPLSDAGGANEGFLRSDAYLSIIFVSDEEDSSPLTTSGYVNTFRSIKGNRSRDIFNASALVVTDAEDCTEEQLNAGATRSDRYADVATQTDGVVGSICSGDFATIVTELSLATSRLTDTFYLSESPEVATIVVGIDGEVLPCEDGAWVYDKVDSRPAIVFDRSQLPPPGSQITASYDSGSGNVDEFCGGSE